MVHTAAGRPKGNPVVHTASGRTDLVRRSLRKRERAEG